MASNSRTTKGKEPIEPKEPKERQLPYKLRVLPNATDRFRTLRFKKGVAPGPSHDDSTTPVPTTPQDSSSTDDVQIENTVDNVSAKVTLPTPGQAEYDYFLQPTIDNQVQMGWWMQYIEQRHPTDIPSGDFAPQHNIFVPYTASDGGIVESSAYPYLNQGPWAYPPQEDSSL